MPYSKEEQDAILRKYDLDPNQFEVVPHGEYAQAPETGTPSATTPSSALGAAYRGAKRSAAPTIAGLLGTAGAAALLGPGTQPAAAVLLPLAAGLGAGFGTGYLQEKISPTTPEEAAERQRDVKEHPVASVAGELAPSLLALKPSFSNLKTALTRLPGKGVDDATRQAIMSQRLNVGLGAGLGALTEVGVPLARGEDISPLRALAATAGGALINEPNRVGRMLGFQPSTALRPSLTGEPQVRPGVGYDQPIGPNELLRDQIDRQLVRPDSARTRGFREAPEQHILGKPLPRESQIPTSEGVPVKEGAEQHADVALNPDRLLGDTPPSPEIFQRQERIAALEANIAEIEQTMRHLPLTERLRHQEIMDRVKPLLAKEKLTLKAELDAGRVVYVSPKGESLSPTPEYPIDTPQDAISREQKVMEELLKKIVPPTSKHTQLYQARYGEQPPAPPTEKPAISAAPKKPTAKGRAKAKAAELPENVMVTVQQPEVMPDGQKVGITAIQIDVPQSATAGDTLSKGPDALRAEGFNVPDFSFLPQGKYTLADAKKALAVRDSDMRLSLRSELGLNKQEVDKLLTAKTPFDRGMNLLMAMQKRGIKTQVLEHTPEGHRVAMNEALRQAADTVKKITGQDVQFKAGIDEPPEIAHQVESELTKAPLADLLRHPNNREVFELLQRLGARAAIETRVEPSLVDEAGEVVFGVAAFKDRIAKLNASMVAEDTLAHELSHILLRDMILQDDLMAMRGLALFGGSEERLTQALGTRVTELAKMQVEGLTMKRFTEWVKDFIAAIKGRWAKGTEEDYKRLLARRIIRGNYSPPKIVVQDPNEIAYQKLVNEQQDRREGLEAALAARTIAVDHGIPGIRSVVDRIRREVNQELGDGLSNVDMEAARYRGRFTNKAQAGVETLNAAERDEAVRYAYDYLDTKGRPSFTPSDKVLDWWEKSYRPFIRDVAAAHKEVGKKILDGPGGRDIHETPYYTPQMLREDVQDLLMNHPNDPKAIQYRDQIVDHIAREKGVSRDQAFAMWESRGRAEHVDSNSGVLDYGPLSRAAGIGLPPSLRENDLMRVLTRYGNRSASALAWHKHVVADPKVAYLAGVPDQFGNAYPKPQDMPEAQMYGRVPVVAEAIKILKGDFSPSDRFFDTLSRGVKVNMMQTLTGAADLTGWWVQALPYIHPSRLGNILTAHLNVRKGIQDGLNMGVITKHAAHLQSPVASSEMKGASKWITRFNRLSDTINTITGRDGLERVTRGLTMILGEMEATANIAHAFNPNAAKGLREHAWRFLDTFADKNWAKQIGDLVKSGQPVPDEIIHRIAANLVDTAQGTYSIRGLPLAALKGEVSPFLSLARWNIEKANNFQKHVISPLTKGNITPFLMTTLGGLIGGAAVEQLREWMTRKKGSQPNWKEVAEAGGDGFLYRAMALSSFSGYGGIITELAKQGMDAVEGRPVTGFRFPAVAFIADVSQRMSQAFQAVKQGENMLETFGVDLPLQLLKDNVQMARIGLNWSVDSKDVDRANKMRDLRVFREMRGLSGSKWGASQRNPFVSQLERDYEAEEDAAESVRLAGQLRSQALSRGTDGSGAINREKVRSLLSSYRTPAQDSMPSLRTSPQEFRAYLQWIAETQGEQAARELLAEYASKQRLDRLKATLVPTLSPR